MTSRGAILEHSIDGIRYQIWLDPIYQKFRIEAAGKIAGKAERWSQLVDIERYDGDTVNQATEALRDAIMFVHPKFEKKIMEHRDELHRQVEWEEELIRQRELDYLAAAAKKEADRQQAELQELEGYGMF